MPRPPRSKIPEGATVKRNAAYTAVRKDARKKGVQESEKAVVKAVRAKNEGMTRKEALKRIANRVKKGRAVGGLRPGQIVLTDGSMGKTIGKKGGWKPKKRSPGDYGPRNTH